MPVSRREMLTKGVAAVPALGLAAPAIFAQQTNPASPSTVPAQQTQPAASEQNLGEDPLLAACLLNGGKRQIEVCKAAMDYISNDEVKAFAKAEIDEHEKIKADLQAKFGYTPPMPVQVQGLPAGVPAPVAVGKLVMPPGASELIKIEGEIADECIKNVKAMLPQKKAEKGDVKFDKSFVGSQYHAHKGLKDQVTVFQRHATAQMKPLLEEGLAIINQHIAACEKLMATLDKAQMENVNS